MDSKGKQIAYQVAFKAAVELAVASNSLDIDSVFDVTNDIYEKLEIALEGFDGAGQPPAPRPAPRARPAPSSGDIPTGWNLTDNACPDCTDAGRDSALLQNEGTKGPEFQCVLRKSEKRGNDWVEVGACTYTDWGANGRF